MAVLYKLIRVSVLQEILKFQIILAVNYFQIWKISIALNYLVNSAFRKFSILC